MSNVTIPRIFKQEQNIKKPLIANSDIHPHPYYTIIMIIIVIIIFIAIVVVYHVQKCHEKKTTRKCYINSNLGCG